MAQHGVAHRDGDALSGVDDHGPPAETVGRLEADAAHPALADLLGDFGGDRDLLAVDVDLHGDGIVDLGQGAGGNSTSTTGPAMATTRPSLCSVHVFGDCGSLGSPGRSGGLGDRGERLVTSPDPLATPAWRSASEPPTISMISVVMESWRARFITRRSVLISSSALSVAAFIARCRAACSDAAALSMAARISDSSQRGTSRSRISAGSGSNS